MRLEELKSLTEDELALLSYAINKTNPPVLAGVELEPSVFCSVKPQAIFHRITQLEPTIKDEHRSIYESLRQKLNMPPSEIPQNSISASVPISASVSSSESV